MKEENMREYPSFRTLLEQERIKLNLIENGYDVVSVKAEYDDSCDPGIGFVVKIKDEKLEFLMRNYAYHLEFTW